MRGFLPNRWGPSFEIIPVVLQPGLKFHKIVIPSENGATHMCLCLMCSVRFVDKYVTKYTKYIFFFGLYETVPLLSSKKVAFMNLPLLQIFLRLETGIY